MPVLPDPPALFFPRRVILAFFRSRDAIRRCEFDAVFHASMTALRRRRCRDYHCRLSLYFNCEDVFGPRRLLFPVCVGPRNVSRFNILSRSKKNRYALRLQGDRPGHGNLVMHCFDVCLSGANGEVFPRSWMLQNSFSISDPQNPKPRTFAPVRCATCATFYLKHQCTSQKSQGEWCLRVEDGWAKDALWRTRTPLR